ncbi:hypothetical protein C2S53_010216 [Perilla frutescens var. hirtella]|uniref:F-box domain-containing protein n=1 Tax=Perilla frutescens var. hirtella TaxID=608512 RepID=A0AAD4ISU0_PERFH|nr:hypothetical protein C2S53_010216 [Perilla frutescens var. hirtella]
MGGMKHTASYDLPHDIIENILFRLPVKSLLRFQGVCKHWKATISDPKFGETHRQRPKNSPHLYLQIQLKKSPPSRLLPQLTKEDAFTRVALENHEFRHHSALEYPPVNKSGSSVWCHCDGLFLISRHKISYSLWNPSCRTYKKLRYPYPVDSVNPLLRSGICYDPLAKDYKVVLGDAKHYAVFYCKRNCWSEMREMNNVCSVSHTNREGVQFKGCIYWIWCSRLICFDGRDETFKDLSNTINLDCRDDYSHSLISSTNDLYIFPVYKTFSVRNEIVIMKKDGDDEEAWMEFVVKLPFPDLYIKPLCSTEENKIVVSVFPGINYLLYDDTERCFTQIQNSSGFVCSRLFPYLENLLLL